MSHAWLGFLKLVGFLIAGALVVGAGTVVLFGWGSAPIGALGGAAGAAVGVRQAVLDYRAKMNLDRDDAA